jgi:hypothetical protein
MNDIKSASRRPIHIGFRTSIITVFVAAVLFVGLTLVYLSFERVSSITQTAASTFIDKVAQHHQERHAGCGKEPRRRQLGWKTSAALRERASSGFVFRRVDRISPKGFAEAFDVYELRCERGEGDARDSELSLEWEVVHAALRHGPSAVAESELSAFMRKYPEDEVARYHQAAASKAPSPPASTS